MRSSFLSFETAKRALTASQLGLATVGNNISNVSTPGYTRQRVDQVSLSTAGYKSKYSLYNGVFAGQGVLATGISQIRDPYLDTRYRNEASNYGELATKISGLTDLEEILDEMDTTKLGTQFAEFIEVLRKHTDVTDADQAAVVRNAAKQLTQYMNATANQLNNTLNQHKEDLNITLTSEVNSIVQQIAYLNEVIRQEHIHGDPANELVDQRNLLIDSLSQYANIKVINTPEKISDELTISQLSIVIMDNTVSPPSEIMLVDNNKYNTLSMNEDDDGYVSIALVDSVTGFPINKDITSNISSGVIRGYVDMINGIGDYAGNGENGFRGVRYYMKALDTFAAKFAEMMNQVNSITTAEAAGKEHIYPYEDKPLFVANDGSNTVTAGNITLSEGWLAEAFYLTVTKEDPEEPEVIKDGEGNDGHDVNSNPVQQPSQNSENLLKFIEMLEGSQAFNIVNGDGTRVTLFRGSFSSYLTNMNTDLGLDKSLQTTLFSASSLVIENYDTQRDSISAVSIDEEAISMMTLQNYYNAAARYMTTIDEALGTIIQGMGVVGR